MTTWQRIESADYVHSVTFRDPAGPLPADQVPVHIVGSRKMHQLDVELDGQLIPGVKDAEVVLGPLTATHVILYVDPNLCDIAPPFRPSDGSAIPAGGLDGHLLLTPMGERDALSPWTYDEETGLVACPLYAARVCFE